MTFDLSLVTIVSSSWLIVICVTVAAPAACAVCMFVLYLAVLGYKEGALAALPFTFTSAPHQTSVCETWRYWVC